MGYEAGLQQTYRDAHRRLVNGTPPKIPLVIPITPALPAYPSRLEQQLIGLHLTKPQAVKVIAIFAELIQQYAEKPELKPQHVYSVGEILDFISAVESVDSVEICSARRTAVLGKIRHITYYLACRYTSASSTMIGRILGNRDHTTILYGRDKIASLRQTDRALDLKLKGYEATLERKFNK